MIDESLIPKNVAVYNFNLTTKEPIKRSGLEIASFFEKNNREYEILDDACFVYYSLSDSYRVDFNFHQYVYEDEIKTDYLNELVKALLQFQNHFHCSLKGHFDYYYVNDILNFKVDNNHDIIRLIAPDFRRYLIEESELELDDSGD